MSSISIAGDSSGSISLTVPAVAGTNTATLPAATGTVMVSGNMPAFSAYQSTLQAISSLTQTVVLFQTEDFDTNNNFASSTFTPTVAGYYQINAAVGFSGALTGGALCSIGKNGSIFRSGGIANTNSTLGTSANVSSLIYLNGTTDYVQIYIFAVTGSNTAAANNYTYFNGSLVRAA
jgi:hypothetical protein